MCVCLSMFESDVENYSSSSSDDLEDNITKSCTAYNSNSEATETFNHGVCSKQRKFFTICTIYHGKREL